MRMGRQNLSWCRAKHELIATELILDNPIPTLLPDTLWCVGGPEYAEKGLVPKTEFI